MDAVIQLKTLQMVERKIYSVVIIHITLMAGCMADFYLEFPTDYYDPWFYDSRNQLISVYDPLPKFKVQIYLFHCEIDEAAPKAQNDPTPFSCFRITKTREIKHAYETYNFYYVDGPKFINARQQIRFIDFHDYSLPANTYVGIKPNVPPIYPVFIPSKSNAYYQDKVEGRIPFLSEKMGKNLVEYIGRSSLLRFITQPAAMLDPLRAYRSALEKVMDKHGKRCIRSLSVDSSSTSSSPSPNWGTRSSLRCKREKVNLSESVETLLPRMIDPCFLEKLMSWSLNKENKDTSVLSTEVFDEYCKVYCQFLTTSLFIRQKSAPSGCSNLNGGKCELNKCICSRDESQFLRMMRSCFQPQVTSTRRSVDMLSCHNAIRIKLFRQIEIAGFQPGPKDEPQYGLKAKLWVDNGEGEPMKTPTRPKRPNRPLKNVHWAENLVQDPNQDQKKVDDPHQGVDGNRSTYEKVLRIFCRE